jgi:hypothetical protein
MPRASPIPFENIEGKHIQPIKKRKRGRIHPD